MFLTKAELKEFTGNSYAKHQARYLSSHGYPFEINAKGEVKVLTSVIQQKLGCSTIRSIRKEPNFEGLLTPGRQNGQKEKGQ